MDDFTVSYPEAKSIVYALILTHTFMDCAKENPGPVPGPVDLSGNQERESYMHVNGSREIPAARQKVWEAFLDPEKLLQGIPGCEKLEALGNDEFKAVMKVGLSAVRAIFEGKFRFSEKNPLRSYRLSAEGNGQPGFVKTETIVTFSDIEGGTLVCYSSKVQVTGLIASIGQRALDSAAKMIANQFFNRMSRLLNDS